jgi:hypothetical protein
MAKQSWIGWLLVVLSLVLLAVSGRLDSWVVLLPISILLAYGLTGLGKSGKSKLTR